MKEWQEPFDHLDLKAYVDERGFLFEILRFKDYNIPGDGQLYTFSIEPGMRRGDHYHLKKKEWFTCVHGAATVLLTSKDGEDKAVEISAEEPRIIFAAPGSTHALINNSETPSIIVSYGSKQHDPDDEDTYYKKAYSDYKA